MTERLLLGLAIAAGAALLLAALVLLVPGGGRAVAHVAKALPRPLLEAIGAAIGAAAWALRVRRRVALENLARAFPERTEAERRAILRRFYGHLGRLVAEFVRAPALRPADLDALVEIEGYDAFEAAYAEGKGAIVTTAHFGNFELLGSLWSRRGLEVWAITKRLSKNPFNAFWLEQRRRAGLRELPDSGSIRDILRVLRDKKVLAIMIDQNMIPRRAIFADFFGTPAATPPAPALVAGRAGAPVFLVLLHRLPEGRHKVTIERIPLERTGDRDADVAALTARLNLALERHVRAEPWLWWWIHRRWKTRPPPAADAPPSTEPEARAG